MARGKLGGTKAKIRGKVGSEIYQLKRSSDGALVQSVYNAPETIAYSNTEAQAKNRMIMGQIERMFHILPDIIYDAFASVAPGQQSFNYFAQLNYPILKQDMIDNWSANSFFDWRPKRDVTAPAGIWKLTDGTLPATTPNGWSSIDSVNNWVMPNWRTNKTTYTLADFYKTMKMNITDEMNILFYQRWADDNIPFVSMVTLKRKKSVPVTTPITNNWRGDYFNVEGDMQVQLRFMPSNGWVLLRIGGNTLTKDYILDCFGFLNVRRKKTGVLFSPCQFDWVGGRNTTLYDRIDPEVSFQTWQNP